MSFIKISSVTGYFFLPVWMTCTWISGYYVNSGRTPGNKMRNSIREDYVIFFLLNAYHSFRPIIPVTEHLPDDIAVSFVPTGFSISPQKCHTPCDVSRPVYINFSTVRFLPWTLFQDVQMLSDCLRCTDTCQQLSWRNSSESAFLCWKMPS